MSANKRMFIISIVLIMALAACNFPSATDNNNQTEIQDNQNADSGEQEDGNNPVEPPTEPEPQPTPEPDIIPLPDFNIADPCSILPSDIVEEILGMEVQPIEGPGTCVYSTGMVSISIVTLEGEAARLALVDQILQLENDCSMSYSFSSDQPDPTPLPPEADPLLVLSLQELMEQSLTLQHTCGGSEFETLSDYGPGVYLLPFELLMPGGLISIAAEDYTLTILYADIEQDAASSVEVARLILELLAAGK